jgi:hypothetical protein
LAGGEKAGRQSCHGAKSRSSQRKGREQQHPSFDRDRDLRLQSEFGDAPTIWDFSMFWKVHASDYTARFSDIAKKSWAKKSGTLRGAMADIAPCSGEHCTV